MLIGRLAGKEPLMKDALGREIITPDGRPPAVPNLPVKIVTPREQSTGWMNAGTAVMTERK